MRKFTRFAVATATMIVTLVGVYLSTSVADLTSDEMNLARGGHATSGKCTESCNRFNNYQNQCASGSGSCFTCSNGLTERSYFAQPTLTCPGFHKTGEGNYDCGLQKPGECTDYYVCTPGTQDTGTCQDSPVVIPQ